jgi:plasmid maintenance system antidote protein VapI
MSLTPPDRGRVVEFHHIALTAFLAALAFAHVAVGWSIYVLAVNEIVNGRCGMTPSTALRLSRYFGTSSGSG